MAHRHIVSLGTNTPLASYNPAIFSVLPGTEKINKSPQADKKPSQFQYFAHV